MNLEDLDKPLTELIDLAPPAIQLYELQTQIAAVKAKLKAREQVFGVLLERLYADRAAAAYTAARKDTGTVHIPASNTLTLTVERDKEPKWDQDILKNILSGMSDADRNHYAKFEIKVDERKYEAAPPDIKTALSRARTVKVGKNKFAFKQVELV